MPWSDCEYGRAICDGCRAASKVADLTGRQTLHLTGAYVPRRSGTDVIYCPMCIMTNDEAFGGKTSHQMSWTKACKFMESHWHTPAEALELGHTGGHPDLPQPAGQHHQNHQSQQVPPGMIQPAEPALNPARAIEDVSSRVEQSPLEAVVYKLTAEVDELKAAVCELREELKLVKTGVARDEELETLQNEIRALKEQLSAQPCPRLTPAQIVHVSG